MDLGDPWMMMSGLLIGGVGFILFTYGRREQNLKALGSGVLLCVYPYFVPSILALWLVFAAILGGLYAISRYD